jgi:hypothetical protein
VTVKEPVSSTPIAMLDEAMYSAVSPRLSTAKKVLEQLVTDAAKIRA